MGEIYNLSIQDLVGFAKKNLLKFPPKVSRRHTTYENRIRLRDNGKDIREGSKWPPWVFTVHVDHETLVFPGLNRFKSE